MTVFDYAKQNSTIETGTFFEHIINTDTSGGGGDCLEVGIPIDIIVEPIPIDISEANPIEIALESQAIALDISDPIIGIDIIPEEIEITIKDC